MASSTPSLIGFSPACTSDFFWETIVNK
jgi:hypothetical protein